MVMPSLSALLPNATFHMRGDLSPFGWPIALDEPRDLPVFLSSPSLSLPDRAGLSRPLKCFNP